MSFAFGIFAVASGLTKMQALLISMTNVTSAGQLAAVPIMLSGGSLIELFVSQLIINLRYALMSVSLSQKLGKTVSQANKFLISFMNTDEILLQILEEQKKIVKDLLQENIKLRKELDAAKDELKRNQFIHSMDDLIEAMKDKPNEMESIYNPFAAYMRSAHSSTSSGGGSDADGSMYGNAFEPDQYCDVPDDAEFGDER